MKKNLFFWCLWIGGILFSVAVWVGGIIYSASAKTQAAAPAKISSVLFQK